MINLKLVSLILMLIIANHFGQDQIEFSAETLDNREITFSEINSSGPTLVTFWALWCKPCRAEMRHLVDLYEKYKNDNFNLIGINQDSPRSVAKVKSFVSSHKISFPIITDTNQEIFQQFNGQSIPLSILYDRNGEAIYTHVGYLPGDEIELEEEIKKVLGLKN